MTLNPDPAILQDTPETPESPAKQAEESIGRNQAHSKAERRKANPRPKPPSNDDRWRAMAERGDLQGLIREMSADGGCVLYTDLLSRYLGETIDKLARADPAAFSASLQADILAGAAKILFRAQQLLEVKLRRQGNEPSMRSDPRDTEDTEKFVALSAEVAKLVHLSAGTRLAIERARKMRLVNDKAEAKKPRQRQPRRRSQRSAPPPTTANTRIGEVI